MIHLYRYNVARDLTLERDKHTTDLLRPMAEQSYIRYPDMYRSLVIMLDNDLPL